MTERVVLRILVTGAGGFVGRHAMATFGAGLGDGDRLVGITREPIDDAPERAEIHRLDLLDGAALAPLLADLKPTHILHLAALASVKESSGAPAQTWRANLVALLNLAEAVAPLDGATFLFASSGEVYGRAFLAGTPLSEAAIPQPANTYARTKLVGETMLHDILSPAGVKLIVLRPFNHIGPGQDERFVASSFAGQIARIEAALAPPVLEVGDLSAKRDFLDVGDVVAAYARLIRGSDGIAHGSIFNIGSGRPRAISDLLDGLRAAARVPFEVRVASDRLRPSEIPTASGDASALTRASGWRPEIPLADSLSKVLAHARAQAAIRRER